MFIEVIPSGVYPGLINKMVHAAIISNNENSACWFMTQKDFVAIAKRWHKLNVESHILFHKPSEEEKETINYQVIEHPSDAPLMDSKLFARWLVEIRENMHLANIKEKRRIANTEQKALDFLDELLLNELFRIMEESGFMEMDPYRMYFDSI